MEDPHKNVLGRVIFNLFEYKGKPVFIPNKGYGPLGDMVGQKAVKLLKSKNIPVIIYDERGGWKLIQGTKTEKIPLGVVMGSSVRVEEYPIPAKSNYKEKKFYYDYGLPEPRTGYVRLRHVVEYR